MDWSLRVIKARQLEKELSGINKVIAPRDGWVRTIREALGMSARQLGTRCNVTSERILRIEKDESEGRTTIATLEKIAKGMDCKLVYAFVPNDGLISFIERTAEEKARSQLKLVSHHMELEDQKVSNDSAKEQLVVLKDEMIRSNIKKLWD